MWPRSLLRPWRATVPRGISVSRLAAPYPDAIPPPTLEALEERFVLSATLLADIWPGSTPGAPGPFTAMNDTLYFPAFDAVHGDELWKTDGTSAGTAMVKDIDPGSNGSSPRGGSQRFGIGMVPIGESLFFWADDGVHGSELWKTDGTAAGTVMVKDINPGSGDATPGFLDSAGASMTNVNGTLFFMADDGTHGRELWRSDGTANGTVLVKDIANNSASSNPHWMTNLNGELFFAASEGNDGEELWKSDGTAAGTVLVKDIDPKSASSTPHFLTDYNGTLIFTANDGVPGDGLWKSDGTAAGTVLIKSGMSLVGGSVNAITIGTYTAAGGFTNVNGMLFFSASDGSSDDELWRTDGTTAGTEMLVDFFPGYNDADLPFPDFLTNVNGRLFFMSYDAVANEELWTSDGTAAGTVRVKDIDPGPLGSGPENLTNVNGMLFFDARDGVNGRELWQSDGTAAGTIMVQDIFPGSGSSNPVTFAALNGALCFAADDGVHGRELWTATPAALPAPQVSSASYPFDTSPNRLQFAFDENVSASLSPADLTLTNLNGGTAPAVTSVQWDENTQTASFILASLPSSPLPPDGDYRATLSGAGVSNITGATLGADYSFDFFILAADANHDRTVDTLDFNSLAANFGGSSKAFSQGDFNYDGVVDTLDFNTLAAQFGKTLPPGAPPARAMATESEFVPRVTGVADTLLAGDGDEDGSWIGLPDRI